MKTSSCLQFPSIFSFLRTLYLFTKSDIKTTVIPITTLATAASLEDVYRLPHIVFWVWLHVLQINIANQILDPEEDKVNKPHRPLASNRITVRNARILRWLSVPACLLLSACYSPQTVYASLAIAILTVIYDEMGGHVHWVNRSTILPVGYAFFEVGACLVAGSYVLFLLRKSSTDPGDGRIGSNPHKLGDVALTSVLMSAGAYGTTYQATDFKDVEGDRILGRKTIPIVAPVLSRPTLMVLICAWSSCLSGVWELGTLSTLALNAFGLFVGARFVLRRTVLDDKRSCLLYNVWLSSIHVLPAYWRFFATTSGGSIAQYR